MSESTPKHLPSEEVGRSVKPEEESEAVLQGLERLWAIIAPLPDDGSGRKENLFQKIQELRKKYRPSI